MELDMEGYVCEAPGYNVFVVKRGALLTRAGRVQVFDLYNADEVFLSSTAGGIVPVVQLDGRMIGNGRRGPITTQIRDGYLSLLTSGAESTPVDSESEP